MTSFAKAFARESWKPINILLRYTLGIVKSKLLNKVTNDKIIEFDTSMEDMNS